MRSINSCTDFTLLLRPVNLRKPIYEVRFGDEHLGTIEIPGRHGRQGKAISADGNWNYNLEGFVNPKTIIKADDETIIATFKPDAFNQTGTLTLNDGHEFKLKIGLFKDRLDVFGKYDERLIQFQNHGIIHFHSDITVFRASKQVKDFPIVFFMSCYFLLAHRRKD
jgi:hypothetical protein